MPGPAPKPTALKIAEGNPGKRKLNSAEPRPTGVAEIPPGLPAEARREWKLYAPQFAKLGLLTELDAPAFAMLCQAWASWKKHLRLAQKQGNIINVNGQKIPNPHLIRADKEAAKLSKLLAEFGATPASRSRIQIDNPEAEGESLDSFITGAAG
jgi:P27 family predicted phage terminase small subunit